MSKTDILQELPKLGPNDRREILDRRWELEERDMLQGSQPTPEEKTLLDRELEDYRLNPDAGSRWEEVESRIHRPAGP